MKVRRFAHPVTFAVSAESRTIKGLAVPFGVVGDNGYGKFQFSKGTLTWGKVKVLDGHDWSRAAGTATLTETDAGLEMVAKIAAGARGDELLALATPDADTGEAVYDGLSIGLNWEIEYDEIDGVIHITAATVLEVSLTPLPAFQDAQITSVTASRTEKRSTNTKENTVMPDEKKENAPVFSAEQGQALVEKVDALTVQLDKLADIKIPVGPTASTKVNEESIYRFAGNVGAPSGFDFATDMLAAANGDGAALARLKTFTKDIKFNGGALGPSFVATSDVNEVNPSTYRPDMFLGQAPVPAAPLYTTFHKGGLADVTPFFYSKLDRVNTDVALADHVEGTDPADGDLVTAVGATITPAGLSGKVHITREVADQGGNPLVSGLVWKEFERSMSISLETKCAGLVSAAAGSITSLTAAIAAGAGGTVAGRAIKAGLVGLQFLADGSRFTKAWGHVDLYTALANAVAPRFEGDVIGEEVYPIINPQNRSGQTGDQFSYIEIGGYRIEPAASLGATSAAASNSIVADPNAVHFWNSGLTQLSKLQETVEGWDLGAFAYWAGVVYDVTGLRKISYDPIA